MLQRFYFDLKEGFSFIRDHEGVEARSLEQAIKEARVVIEEMRDSGGLCEAEKGWVLVIRDGAGDTLMTLPVNPCIPTPVTAS